MIPVSIRVHNGCDGIVIGRYNFTCTKCNAVVSRRETRCIEQIVCMKCEKVNSIKVKEADGSHTHSCLECGNEWKCCPKCGCVGIVENGLCLNCHRSIL